jgi:hypothetical protein
LLHDEHGNSTLQSSGQHPQSKHWIFNIFFTIDIPKSVNMVAGGNGEVTISEDGSTPVGKYRGADLSEGCKFAIDG